MKKYFAEFVGTFLLLAAILVAIHFCNTAIGILTTGTVLTIAIYWGGPICKAHYNPAITLAFALRKQIERKDIAGYLVAQFAAALAAVQLSWWILPYFQIEPLVATREFSLGVFCMAEFVGTFFLAAVIMQVATRKTTVGNKYYGIAISATVMIFAFLLGKYSAAAFNPAVALAFGIIKLSSWKMLLYYFLSQTAGAAVAAGLYQFLYGYELQAA